MKFGGFKDANDNLIFVNPMNITRLYQAEGYMTTIVFDRDNSISVKEDVGTVLRALQDL
jgi:type IV secretory pathway VirB9-like protein